MVQLSGKRLLFQDAAVGTESSGTSRTEFSYDGLDRRVRVVEKQNGVEQSNQVYLWDGTEIVQRRDSTGATVERNYFGQGYEEVDNDYFYTKDHLGSIREVVASDGLTIEAVYDYSPWGEVERIGGASNSIESDFLYTGHFFHSKSDLHLTLYRAYDPALGMWLSRDPIAENGGINMYAYVGNNPVNYWDPYGLKVEVKSRDVLGGLGAHTWVEVTDSKGDRCTFSGTDENGKLGVKKNIPKDFSPTPKNPVTSSQEIKPPAGMTQDQWDEAVKKSGEKQCASIDEKRDYKLLGGDRGVDSGNCHCVTRQIIQGAGGKVPQSYDPPGANPGLHKK